MAESFGDLSITIRVNKQTGELEVLKGQLTDAKQKVDEFGNSSKGTSDQLDGLTSSLLKVASTTAIIAFIQDAIRESVASAEATRVLKTQMESLWLSYETNSVRIKEWASSMQTLAHIEDDVVVAALGRTVQKVRDLDQAMMLVQLAQDIAVASNRDFNTTLDSLSKTASGAQRGLMMLKLEYGKQLEGINSNQEALDVLTKTYGGAAQGVDSFKFKTIDMTNEIKNRIEELGDGFTAAGSWISETFFRPLLDEYDRAMVTTKTTGAVIVDIFVGAFQVVGEAVARFGVALYHLNHLHFKELWQSVKEGTAATVDVMKEYAKHADEIMKEGAKEQKAIDARSLGDKKSHLETLGQIKASATSKETSEVLAAMDTQVKAIRDKEALELSLADTTAATKLSLANVNGSENLQIIQENIARKMQLLNQAASDEITLINATKAKVNDEEFKSADRILAVSQQLMIKQSKLRMEQTAAEKKSHDERAANFSSTLNVISSLATNKNKELAAIGKAAAITVASMDTYAAANKALASAPPPFNFLLAAAVVAAGLANVAKIASFRDGGVMTSGGRRYSNGGIANSPQLAEFGEGSGPEAFVPLPDGRSIPVTLKGVGRGQSSSGGQSITINLGGIVVNMAGIDPNNVDYFVSELSRRVATESAQMITLALRMKNLADRNERTAV